VNAGGIHAANAAIHWCKFDATTRGRSVCDRGYFKASVTPRQMRVDLRFMTSVENQGGSGYTQGSWVVEDGQPGAHPA